MLNTAYPDNTYNPQQNELRDMQKQTLELQNNITRLGFPTILTKEHATLEDIQLHAILRQRLNKTTAHNRITTLQRITQHKIPIDLNNPTLEQWINHSDYREQIENATHALHNEWKAIRTLLKAYNIPIWPYQPPTLPGRQRRTIQKPETIRQMIHTPYTNKPYIDTHIQYILLATYMIGLRNPSETALLQTTDIDLDAGTITVTEPKKRGSTRDVYPTQQYMTGRNCKSIRNWIDHIRPRYTNQHSKETLFITLQGHPFTKNYLRKYLNEHIKPIYPEYQPYLCRHWAATAKLIQEYIETKNWNKPRVQRWLGHEHETTTDTYISQAENYLHRYPYDWFHHVLKKPAQKVWGKHGEKTQNGEKRLCDEKLLPLEGYEPVGVWTLSTGENKIDKTPIFSSAILWEPIYLNGEEPMFGSFTFSFEHNHMGGESEKKHFISPFFSYIFSPSLSPPASLITTWDNEMLAEPQENIMISYPNTFNRINQSDIQVEYISKPLCCTTWVHTSGMSEYFFSVVGLVFGWSRHPTTPPFTTEEGEI